MCRVYAAYAPSLPCGHPGLHRPSKDEAFEERQTGPACTALILGEQRLQEFRSPLDPSTHIAKVLIEERNRLQVAERQKGQAEKACKDDRSNARVDLRPPKVVYSMKASDASPTSEIVRNTLRLCLCRWRLRFRQVARRLDRQAKQADAADDQE